MPFQRAPPMAARIRLNANAALHCGTELPALSHGAGTATRASNHDKTNAGKRPTTPFIARAGVAGWYVCNLLASAEGSAIRRRRHPGKPFELPAEMALIEIAAGSGDARDTLLGSRQQFGSGSEAIPRGVVARRLAIRAFEGAVESDAVHTQFRCQRTHRSRPNDVTQRFPRSHHWVRRFFGLRSHANERCDCSDCIAKTPARSGQGRQETTLQGLDFAAAGREELVREIAREVLDVQRRHRLVVDAVGVEFTGRVKDEHAAVQMTRRLP